MLALVAATAALAPQDRDLREYEQRRLALRIQSGQRHLEYGLALRKKGLTTPAAEQLFLAVELSRGHHGTAESVLKLMRNRSDSFWKRELKRPTRAQLEGYTARSGKLRDEDRNAHFDLVRWCEGRGLAEQAAGELNDLFLDLERPLVFEPDGSLELPWGRLTGALARHARESAVEINGQLYPRDLFLSRLRHVPALHESASDALVVRTTTSAEDARELHALSSALFPVLEAENGARPSRRLQVVVLEKRADYEAYLDAVGLQRHRTADGFADLRCATAVLTSEGSDRDHVLGLVLHELTHLYQLALSRAVLPSWYLEGSAEASGGEGTFTWDGTTLVTGLPMDLERLRAVQAERMPLTPFLEGEALHLLGRDRAAARRFYAQSWAFVRFLETGLEGRHARRFERWLDLCLGSGMGADLDRPYAGHASESLDLFFELFGKDLDELEEAFVVWLDGTIATLGNEASR